MYEYSKTSITTCIELQKFVIRGPMFSPQLQQCTNSYKRANDYSIDRRIQREGFLSK
jgi:hypothetical protein